MNDASHLLVTRRREGLRVCDWPVDDVDDAVGGGQVGLDDGVHSAGVAHQDELLNRNNMRVSLSRSARFKVLLFSRNNTC